MFWEKLRERRCWPTRRVNRDNTAGWLDVDTYCVEGREVVISLVHYECVREESVSIASVRSVDGRQATPAEERQIALLLIANAHCRREDFAYFSDLVPTIWDLGYQSP